MEHQAGAAPLRGWGRSGMEAGLGRDWSKPKGGFGAGVVQGQAKVAGHKQKSGYRCLEMESRMVGAGLGAKRALEGQRQGDAGGRDKGP